MATPLASFRQQALFCRCGRDLPVVAGRCRRCYRADWRFRHFFGGHRGERILTRDRCCQVCGRDAGVCVHHRRPAENDERLLIAVCRACHARIHRRHRLPGWAPPLLGVLWEEQHTGWPVQLQLAYSHEDSAFKAAA
jgi:hypothetical protein